MVNTYSLITCTELKTLIFPQCIKAFRTILTTSSYYFPKKVLRNVFVFILLLSQGRAGEAWKPSKPSIPFVLPAKQKCLSLLSCLLLSYSLMLCVTTPPPPPPHPTPSHTPTPLTLQAESPASHNGESHWNLCWTKWHWYRFCSERFSFLVSIIPPTLILIFRDAVTRRENRRSLRTFHKKWCYCANRVGSGKKITSVVYS